METTKRSRNVRMFDVCDRLQEKLVCKSWDICSVNNFNLSLSLNVTSNASTQHSSPERNLKPKTE
ncbi:CLUMA_CG019911, isoform A [Clunio marinus]|uniref:CLUMA_CG019911, isoform A n=1 Tax=Clunio marinus TaxID=568069 RepID=A0A1J1J402_9DIPT|nr:CLUMA_CG019911, isoform A [Clunio marinus]